MDILVDIKYCIASKDPEAWFKLWWFDPEFKESYTCKEFIDVFVYKKENTLYFPFDIQWVTYPEQITIDTKVFEKGSQVWYKNDRLHCLFAPAYTDPLGNEEWFKEGQRHRDGDQPARIRSDGFQGWYKEGKCHRDGDQPAIIESDGSQYWHKEGKCHRDGNQPALIDADGSRYWCKEGNLHRDGDQPAVIESDGSQFWYKEGKLHRDGDQPAVIHADGTQKRYKHGVLIVNFLH